MNKCRMQNERISGRKVKTRKFSSHATTRRRRRHGTHGAGATPRRPPEDFIKSEDIDKKE